MKPQIKKKIRIKGILNNGKGRRFRKKTEMKADNSERGDKFGATVHSSEPILKVKEEQKKSVWQKDLAINLSCAVLLTTALALFCMSIDSPEFIPFTLTCPVLFMAVAETGSLKPGKAQWIAAGAAAVILMVTAIIWHSEIFGGISMLINTFYDAAEEAQAYLYDRLPAGYDATDTEGSAGLAWISGLIGLLAVLPPAGMRRAVSGLTAVIVMTAFAYYGLIPSAVCIAVMIAALLVAVSQGNVLSFVPVILAALVLFGAVMLIDPGESYGISRMDENFRDRFALRSALLESDYSMYDEYDEEDYEENMWEEEEDEYEDEEEADYATYAVLGGILLAVAALGAAAYLILRRISKKRAQNRRGINSSDPREAVTAMFPYAVRWLRGYGVEQTDASFASMEPALRSEFSENYANLYMDMYSLWNEAAYSDHDVSERSRMLMQAFTEDTVDQVKKKCKFRDKLRLRFRYAL